MSSFNRIIEKLNFKKIFAGYIIFSLIAGIFCAGWVGYIYRDKIQFMLRYHQTSERLESGFTDTQTVRGYLDELARSSKDIVDILLLDSQNNILYSCRDTKLAWEGSLHLKRSGDSGDFFVSEQNNDVVFRFVAKEEFLLSSVFEGTFSEVYDEYDKENFYHTNFLNKKVYLLSFLRGGADGSKVYVIGNISPVPYGAFSLKTAAAAAMLLFMLYWIITALWVYQNARKAHLSAPFWGIAVLFTNIAGVLVYSLYKHMNGFCPFCGAVQDKSHLFCTNCGKKIANSCPGCGHTLAKNDRYCGKCGHNTGQEEA